MAKAPNQTEEQPQAEAQPKQDSRRQAKSDLAAAKARAKAERPFYKKPWVWIVGIVAVIIIINLASGSEEPADTGGSNAAQENTGGTAPQDTDSTAVGQSASDGQFTFTVNDFQCGVKKIGSGFLAASAQGQFCVADMTVKNTGDQASLLDSSSQYAYIGDKEYTASSEVFAASKKAENFFLENINPGNSVEGIVVWDVPEGEKPDRLELHDSPFSGGVTVTP